MSISLGVIASKQAISEGAPPHTILVARMVLGGLLIAPLLPRALARTVRPPRPLPLAAGAAAGVALCVGGRLELEGLARLPAGTLAVLLATIPVWVTLVAWLGFGRALQPLAWIAIVAVVVGVATMAAPLGEAIDPLGATFGIATALCFTGFLVLLERNRAVPAASGFPLAIVGAGVVLLVASSGSVADLIAGEVRLPLILASGASTAVWALLVGIGLQSTDSVTTSIVVAAEPVLVALLAFVLLGEGLSAREIAGGLVVLCALGVTTLQVARESASERAAAARGRVPEAPGAVQRQADGTG